VGKDDGVAVMTSKYLDQKLHKAEQVLQNKQLLTSIRQTQVFERFQEKRDRTAQGRQAEKRELERDCAQLKESFKDAIQANCADIVALEGEHKKAEKESTDLACRSKKAQILIDTATKKKNDMDAIAGVSRAEGDTVASTRPTTDSIAANMEKIQKAFPNMNPKELEDILEAASKHTQNASLVLTDTMHSFQELATPVHGMIAELEVCRQEHLEPKVAFRWVMDYYRSKGLPLSADAINDSNNWRKILHFMEPNCSDDVVIRVSKSLKLRDLCFAVPKSEEKQEEKKEVMDDKCILALAEQVEDCMKLKLKWSAACQKHAEIQAHILTIEPSDDDDDDDETCSKAQRAAQRAEYRAAREQEKTLRAMVSTTKAQLVSKVRNKMSAEFDLYNSAYNAIPAVYEFVTLESGLGTTELNLKRIYTYFNGQVIDFIEDVDDFYAGFLDTVVSDLKIQKGAIADESAAKKATVMVLDWAGES